MSTTVCRGVQPHFSPWLELFEPQVLWFDLSVSSQEQKLLAKKQQQLQQQQGKENSQNFTTHNNKSENEQINEIMKKNSAKKESFKGWSFLQALSETAQKGKKENEEVYVHPLTKKSASMLSEKSLEMCTESLGSETGSDMSENGDDLMVSMNSESERCSRMSCFGVTRRTNGGCSFPPPLTTISDGGVGVRVEHLREDGRLVIKAVSVETHQSCFKAERSDGRLRLHLVSSESDSCSSIDSMDDEEYFDDDCDEYENYDAHDDDSDDGFDCGDDGDVGDEVELGNFGRPMSCKEGDDGRIRAMFNLEQIWVAT